jgi:serine/threonine protein kinase
MIHRTSQYRIVQKLGSGCCGVVYEAEDRRMHRLVALKFVPRVVAKQPETLAHFGRETRAASAFHYPNTQQPNMNPGTGGDAWT